MSSLNLYHLPSVVLVRLWFFWLWILHVVHCVVYSVHWHSLHVSTPSESSVSMDCCNAIVTVWKFNKLQTQEGDQIKHSILASCHLRSPDPTTLNIAHKYEGISIFMWHWEAVKVYIYITLTTDRHSQSLGLCQKTILWVPCPLDMVSYPAYFILIAVMHFEVTIWPLSAAYSQILAGRRRRNWSGKIE